MRYKIARIYDFTTQEDFICELKTKVHGLRCTVDKGFIPTCLWCKSMNVVSIEETVQFGMECDKHYLMLFCPLCSRASFHTYELGD